MTTPLLPDLPGPETFGPKLLNILPIVDPEADIDADAFNHMRVTLAALAKVTPKALCHFSVAAGVATLQWHAAVWEDTAAPPVVQRTGLGVYTVTWPPTVYDLADPAEQHSVVLRHVTVGQTIDPATTHVSVDAKVQGDARSVIIRTRSAAATAVDIAQCFVTVR